MKLLPQKQMGDWQPYVFYEKEFSPAECEAIIALAKTLRPESALTGAGDAPHPEIRTSELRWLRHAKSSKWVFERLARAIGSIQQNWYPFHLSGFAEPIQITRYLSSEGGHYTEHRDFGPAHMSTRKLSIVVLLNDPKEFEGGQLELLSIPGPDKAVHKIAQGTVIAFPSWELHRVLHVTKGERWSLVCWVHGPPFV